MGQIFTFDTQPCFSVEPRHGASTLRIQIAGSYYHVTCRGNERKTIYRDDTDRQAFLNRRKSSFAIYQVELHAYVLM